MPLYRSAGPSALLLHQGICLFFRCRPTHIESETIVRFDLVTRDQLVAVTAPRCTNKRAGRRGPLVCAEDRRARQNAVNPPSKSPSTPWSAWISTTSLNPPKRPVYTKEREGSPVNPSSGRVVPIVKSSQLCRPARATLANEEDHIEEQPFITFGCLPRRPVTLSLS